MFREVTMIELKEVLRLWGKGFSRLESAGSGVPAAPSHSEERKVC
jgi:hypothetical protein